MMAARCLTVLLFALTVPVSLATPQGLGDAAAHERARRDKQQAKAGGAGKSFSNTDLDHGKPADAGAKKATEPATPSQPAASSPSEPDRSPDPPTATPPPPPQPPVASRIPELEARIKTLQDKLNPMSGSYIFGPFGSNDPTEEPRTREELQRLEAELVQAREEAANPPPQRSNPSPQ